MERVCARWGLLARKFNLRETSRLIPKQLQITNECSIRLCGCLIYLLTHLSRMDFLP